MLKNRSREILLQKWLLFWCKVLKKKCYTFRYLEFHHTINEADEARANKHYEVRVSRVALSAVSSRSLVPLVFALYMAGDDDRGLIERIGEGAVPGTAIGAIVGSARAYLNAQGLAEASATAIAAAQAAPVPPTKSALRALRPKV